MSKDPKQGRSEAERQERKAVANVTGDNEACDHDYREPTEGVALEISLDKAGDRRPFVVDEKRDQDRK
ncbi:hypothetical protein D9M70_552370 [compost metagenome]